ncbi:unnamed protein product [Lathyrus oleraceus]|uniref:agamous-like MADS-box protein AGL80 n=1 Tax=Pisum sativum TaxID=3888 RepID=UPI001FC3EF2B|nr:agamous-like MADS-box protein AGL80 [Pisum sativum]
MARGKVKLAYIINNSTRKATFKKRKDGIINKMNELSTLCGIDACAIIYGENYPQAEVWPSRVGVRNVLSRFMSLPELERSKKMVDLESFLAQSIMKAKGMLRKQVEENQKKEMAYVISQFIHTGGYNMANVSSNDVTSLSAFIDTNLKEVEQRLNSMDVQDQEEVANGARVVNEGDMLANMDHANILGLETNINYGMQNDDQFSINFSEIPFHDVNVNPNRF